MKELRQVVDAYPDKLLVAEAEDPAFMGTGNDELHLVFNFPLMQTKRLTAQHIRASQQARLTALPEGGWPCNTLGNHDSPRVWSRFGDGKHDREQAELSLAVLMTLKGTPFLYYGEEIGMQDRHLEEIAQFRDTLALRQYDLAVGHGFPEAEAFEIVRKTTRDVCRTPMQWSGAGNAGFSSDDVETWLPVHSDHTQGVKVADQVGDPASMLGFYRSLISLRKATPALRLGDYRPLVTDQEDCLCFVRALPEQRCLVILNFSSAPHTLDLAMGDGSERLLFSSVSRSELGDLHSLQVAPYEVVIAELGA